MRNTTPLDIFVVNTASGFFLLKQEYVTRVLFNAMHFPMQRLLAVALHFGLTA